MPPSTASAEHLDEIRALAIEAGQRRVMTRLARVAELRAAGLACGAIAGQVGVTPRTVSRDLVRLRQLAEQDAEVEQMACDLAAAAGRRLRSGSSGAVSRA